MDLRLDDVCVVVTGAGAGIGAAIARGFGAAGASVAVHYNQNREGAEQVAASIQSAGATAVALRADLTDRAQVARLFDEAVGALGGVDVLVNNAGDLVARNPIDTTPDETYDAAMELNFGSVFQACKAAVPAIRRRGGGAIVNITSIAARNGGGPGSALYCASKGAVSSFTRALAKELAPDGIRVNAISPGIIDTAFHTRHTTPAMLDAMVGTIPLGRVGTPEEVVGPAIFLASEQLASFVTGHVLEVNGGQLMG